MSANLIGFLFGSLLVAMWSIGIRRGTMLGHDPIVGLPFSSRLWVRREAQPLKFWCFAGLYGAIALAVWMVPIARWVAGA